MFDLKGKVALVTGAASGIGFAYVQELLKNELKGVAIIDVDVAKGQAALEELTKEFGNNRAIFVITDVADQAQFEEAFKTTVQTFGQLDIVINNAAIIQELQWGKCIDVNLGGVVTGSMLAMEKYLPQYRSQLDAVIINTSSIVSFKPCEELPTYCATKSGIIAFSRALAGDTRYKKSNVRILTICPGLTKTPFNIVTNEQIAEPYLSTVRNRIRAKHGQKPETLAENVMRVIRQAPTGSVWIAVNDTCTQAEFPKSF